VKAKQFGTVLLGTAQPDGNEDEKRKFDLIDPDQAGAKRKRILRIRG
jgi:hypothetical protein